MRILFILTAILMFSGWTHIVSAKIPLWLKSELSRNYRTISAKTDSVVLYHEIALKYAKGRIHRKEKILIRVLKPKGISLTHKVIFWGHS